MNITTAAKNRFLKLRRLSRKKKMAIIIGIVGVGAAILLVTGGDEVIEESGAAIPEVRVVTVSDVSAGSSFSAVGTVESVSEVDLRAERGGQVIAVNAELGTFVRAGTVLVQFEGKSEQAALIQAQGAYDAAVAGAAQGDSGVRNAEIAFENAEEALSTAVRNSYTTLSSTLFSTIDPFFSSPTTQVPGLRVSGDASFLNTERIAFQTLLPSLKMTIDAVTAATNDAASAEARIAATRMIAVVDSLQNTVTRQGESDKLLGQPLSSYSASLVSARAALVGLVSGLEAAERATASAAESLAQAKIGGSASNTSSANAQVKIALGSLRAAQANYEKTLVRTPISGVVNSLTVKRGDYASPSQDIARVSSNSGLQVTTAVSETERERLSVGDTVVIDGIATGTVAAIGGAVDPVTGKVALKVAVEPESSLVNGSTVKIQFSSNSSTVSDNQPLVIPLTAIKLTADSAFVFTVRDSVLEAIPVGLGPVTGDSVVVQEGLNRDSAIVVDVRGRKAGETVTVVTQ